MALTLLERPFLPMVYPTSAQSFCKLDSVSEIVESSVGLQYRKLLTDGRVDGHAKIRTQATENSAHRFVLETASVCARHAHRSIVTVIRVLASLTAAASGSIHKPYIGESIGMIHCGVNSFSGQSAMSVQTSNILSQNMLEFYSTRTLYAEHTETAPS